MVSGAINHSGTNYAQSCLLNKHIIMYMNLCLCPGHYDYTTIPGPCIVVCHAQRLLQIMGKINSLRPRSTRSGLDVKKAGGWLASLALEWADFFRFAVCEGVYVSIWSRITWRTPRLNDYGFREMAGELRFIRLVVRKARRLVRSSWVRLILNDYLLFPLTIMYVSKSKII